MARANPVCSTQRDRRKRPQLRATAHQQVGHFFEPVRISRVAPTLARGPKVERGPYPVGAAIRIRATIEQPRSPFPVQDAGGGVERRRAVDTRGMNQRRIGSQDVEGAAALPCLDPE
jgi:hypothetical protein